MKKMKAILKAALFTPNADGRWGLPMLFIGAPGIAKSAFLASCCAEFDLALKVLPPGAMGEGMFGCVPVPVTTPEGTYLTFPAPAWTRTFEAGVVFPDETNTAPPALVPAVNGLILDSRLGDHVFGPRVRRMGAANPVGQTAGSWDLAPSTANRLGHMDWQKPDAAEWAEFLRNRFVGYGKKVEPSIDSLDEEARVMKEWGNGWSRASALISTFIERRGSDLLHKMPADGDANQSRAWPSHRSWEMATLAYASGLIHGLPEDDHDLFVKAFVGDAAFKELDTFRATLDLLDPADVLDGKVKFTHDPKRLDRTFVTLAACAQFVVPQDLAKRKERAAACWKLLGTVAADAPDVTVNAGLTLCSRQARLAGIPEARPVLAKIQPMLEAAGYVAGAS